MWTKNFITNYIKKLSPIEKIFAEKYTNALKAYFLKEYAECIKHLEQIEAHAIKMSIKVKGKYTPVFTKMEEIRVYLLKIRACYEGNGIFRDKLERTCQYFRRDLEELDSLNDTRKKGYLIFIEFAEKLNALRFKNTKKNMEEINNLKNNVQTITLSLIHI